VDNNPGETVDSLWKVLRLRLVKFDELCGRALVMPLAFWAGAGVAHAVHVVVQQLMPLAWVCSPFGVAYKQAVTGGLHQADLRLTSGVIAGPCCCQSCLVAGAEGRGNLTDQALQGSKQRFHAEKD
jgi:hypothetical protein